MVMLRVTGFPFALRILLRVLDSLPKHPGKHKQSKDPLANTSSKGIKSTYFPKTPSNFAKL